MSNMVSKTCVPIKSPRASLTPCRKCIIVAHVWMDVQPGEPGDGEN